MYRLLLILLVLPVATAQVDYDLSLGEPTDTTDLLAVGATRQITIPWRLDCTATPQAAGATTQTGTLAWGATAGDGLITKPPVDQAVTLPDCATTTVTEGNATFEVAATLQAPGLTPLEIPVNATLDWGDTLGEAQAEGQTTATVTVGYVGLLMAKAPATIFQGDPGSTTTMTFDIRNAGNAPSRIDVTIDSDAVTLPEAQVVEAGANMTFTATYAHPDKAGWDNTQTTVRFTFTPVAEADGTQDGDPVIVNVLVRTRTDLKAPGVPTPLLIGTLLAIALLVRR